MAVDAAEFAEEDPPLRQWSTPESQLAHRQASQAAVSSGGSGSSGLGRIGRAASTGAGRGWSALPGGGITRLIWAVAIGLIALEVVSEATGTYWNFRLPGFGSWQKKPYQPLYSGQSVQAATPGGSGNPVGAPPPGTGSPADANPGIFGGTTGASVVAGWHSASLSGGI